MKGGMMGRGSKVLGWVWPWGSAPLSCSPASDFAKWTAIVPINSIECYSLQLSGSRLLRSLGLVYPLHLSHSTPLSFFSFLCVWNRLHLGLQQRRIYFLCGHDTVCLHVSPFPCSFFPSMLLILCLSFSPLFLHLRHFPFLLNPPPFSVCVRLCVCVHVPQNSFSDRGRKACPVPHQQAP